MARGILYVETRPSSPEKAEEYHRWYNDTHLAEVTSVKGFVSARRMAPVDGEGPFVAIYEIEADDLQSAVAAMTEAAGRGEIQMSDALGMDPPPTMRLLETIADTADVP